MDKQLLLVMAASLAAILPIVVLILHSIDRKDKSRHSIGTVLAARSKRSRTFRRIYASLIAFPLTRAYVERIRRRYEILYPGELNQISETTVKTVLAAWCACIAAIGFIITNPDFTSQCIGLILVYVISNEITGIFVNRTEARLLEDMVIFISNVRHNYYVNRMLDDAVYNSMEGLRYEMKAHAAKLYEILISDNLKNDVMLYNTTTHNRYLKMFLSLCVSVLEYSDKKVNGQYLFINNIENLKKEINIEILKQRKLRYLFSGVTFVTIAAIVPINTIKNFSLSMMPELGFFYLGKPGAIYVMVTLILSVTVYALNNRLKETKQIIPKDYRYLRRLEQLRPIRIALDNHTDKHYGKMEILKDLLKKMGESITPRQLLLKQLIYAFVVFLTALCFIFYVHQLNRNYITGTVSDITDISEEINVNQKTAMANVILTKVNDLRKEKDITKEVIYDEITRQKHSYNTSINETIANEVYRRLVRYQNEYFKWYELLICIAASVISFYTPYLMVLFRKKVLLMNMEDEVNQFNSIIYMMMFIDYITVKDLLEELELFAVVFKKSIQECINDYNSGEVEALSRLKENESYLPFKRLVDNLIRCDSMSMDKAFDEISSDRENYHDRRKQENEISIQKRVDIAKPLSWIPTVMVMVYLTLPLVIASMQELQEFNEAMKNI